MKTRLIILIFLLVATTVTTASENTVSHVTADGITVYGEKYYADLPLDSPLVMLFHQGGSNGRGEYGALVAWLNNNGYRAIAWDQRAGGETFGSVNRTKNKLGKQDVGYCDAIPDLQAALDYTINEKLAKDVIVWGSSYSGSLAFGLAADNPETVAGVIAFSPASGSPMVGCRARRWLKDVSQPIFVLRPESEMERESPIEQKAALLEHDAEFLIVKHGIHGSSMLVDERTEKDMSDTRDRVIEWLDKVSKQD